MPCLLAFGPSNEHLGGGIVRGFHGADQLFEAIFVQFAFPEDMGCYNDVTRARIYVLGSIVQVDTSSQLETSRIVQQG